MYDQLAGGAGAETQGQHMGAAGVERGVFVMHARFLACPRSRQGQEALSDGLEAKKSFGCLLSGGGRAGFLHGMTHTLNRSYRVVSALLGYLSQIPRMLIVLFSNPVEGGTACGNCKRKDHAAGDGQGGVGLC